MDIVVVRKSINSDRLHGELRTILADKLDGVSANGFEVTVHVNGEIDSVLRQEVIGVVEGHDGKIPVLVDITLLEGLVNDLGPDPTDWDFATMTAAGKWRVVEWMFRRISRG